MARKGMVGRVSKIRSRNMAAVKAKDTKPELLLRKQLSALGLRYRLHRSDLPGKPDIIFPRAKLAVFCDGDFWHGRDWKKRKLKGEFKIRNKFWVMKIEENIARDKRNNLLLKRLGWQSKRFWSSDILKRAPQIAKEIQAMVARTK